MALTGPGMITDQQVSIQKTFWVILLSRFALNMQMRVIYPFLPAIGRALGVSLGTTSLLLTARAVANLSSPIYGALSDRFGRRALMLAGLVILTTGTLFVALAPSFGAVLVAVAFLSLCKAVYDPAVLAYLGDEIPYERRGRMMGLLALMWPLAWLIGVPLTGYLIDRVNWRAPFWMIFLLGMVSLGLALHYRTLGAGKTRSVRNAEIQGWEPFAHKLRMQVQAIPRSGWLALMVTLLMIMASENIYMVYGAWLEDEFSLSLTALGAFSIVISAAEISAESISTLWVDRIGKRKAVIIGLTLNGMAYLLLPQLASSLAGALTGLFLVYITFDFGIVSALPLISELAPEKRGTLMALNVSAMAAGRLLSSLSAIKLWTAGGLAANAASSAFAVFIALVILIGLVRERKLETQPAAS